MKKQIILRVLLYTALIFLLAFPVLGQSTQTPPPPAGTLTFFNGKVTLTDSAGKDIPVALKMQIYIDQKITTGPESTVEIKLPDTSVLKIGANSQFVIKGLPTADKKQSIFQIIAGLVRAIVAPQGTGTFTITTPNGVASVRGTDFGVTVGSNGDTNVGVFNGSVGFGDALLAAGQMLSAINGVVSAVTQISDAFKNQVAQVMKIEGADTTLPENHQGDTGTTTTGNTTTGNTTDTTTTGQTDQQQQTQNQAKSELEKFIEKYLKLFGDFGSTTIGNQVWATFTVNTELDFGEVGFALYFPIIYGNDLFNPVSWYNYDSFNYDFSTFSSSLDSVGKILSLFRYFRIGHVEDPFYLKIGQFNDFMLGNGMNMFMFSNMYDFPKVRRMGVNSTFMLGGFGLNIAVDELTKPQVIGLRPFIQFIPNVPLYWGIEASADISPLYYQSTDTGYNEPIYGALGTGFMFPIINLSGFLTITAYGDFSVNYVDRYDNPGVSTTRSFYLTNGFGIFAGLRGNILSFISYRLEYRMLGGEYIPQVFGVDYQINRTQFVNYFKNATALDFANIGTLFSTANSGLYLTASFDLFEHKIYGSLGWSHYLTGTYNSALVNDLLSGSITLVEGVLDPFDGTIYILKPNFLDPNIQFLDNLTFKINIGYTISKGFKVILGYDIYYIPNGTGGYDQQMAYSMTTQISIF